MAGTVLSGLTGYTNSCGDQDYNLLKERLNQLFGQWNRPPTVRRKLGELCQSKE
jgi:hypothetical protein